MTLASCLLISAHAPGYTRVCTHTIKKLVSKDQRFDMKELGSLVNQQRGAVLFMFLGGGVVGYMYICVPRECLVPSEASRGH